MNREHLGFKIWREAELVAKHRAAWRRLIDAPLILQEER